MKRDRDADLRIRFWHVATYIAVMGCVVAMLPGCASVPGDAGLAPSSAGPNQVTALSWWYGPRVLPMGSADHECGRGGELEIAVRDDGRTVIRCRRGVLQALREALEGGAR